MLFAIPSTTEGAVPRIARHAVSTTCSGLRLFLDGLDPIPVSVSPGDTANMRSPNGRFSSDKASLNLMT